MVTNLLPGIVAVDVAGPGRQVRGTGLVLRSDGMILTTSALVSDANTITVTASDGREWNANLVGTDPATGAAVISVPAAGLKVLPLGTDDTLAAGQLSVSVSAPSQAGADPRVAIDLVSGVDQQVDLGGGSSLMDAIVTNSAPPDPMGSVILDSEGRVVGILQSVLTVGGAAHGVATPIAVLQAAAESLVAGQQVVHAWLGVTGSQPPRSQVNAPGQASATPSPGALVDQVAPASPAATAGLRPGDVITAVDGHPVASMAALDGDLGSLQPGTTVILTVERGRSFLSTAVTLDGQPGSAP